MSNGGIVGPSSTPSITSANGKWSAEEVYAAVKSGTWPGTIVTSNLVLNLDAGNTASYPGTGTTWYDLSGSGNNATLTNGPTFTSPYIQMDGTDDYAVTASSSSFAFGTGDFTLETWIYPQSFSSYLHLLSFPTQDTLALKLEATSGIVYLYSPSWTTYGNGTISGWTPPLNTWSQVVFTRVSGTGYAYLNGVSKGSYGGFTTSFSAQSLQIHKGHPTEFAQARFSVARVYTKGFSATEVSQNFNALRSRFGV